jgi:hypothetical protein
LDYKPKEQRAIISIASLQSFDKSSENIYQKPFVNKKIVLSLQPLRREMS